ITSGQDAPIPRASFRHLQSQPSRRWAPKPGRAGPRGNAWSRLLGFGVALVMVGSALLVASALPVQAVASLPAGFSESTYASGFGYRLSTMTWSPDGRLFVSEKAGALRVVKNGQLLAQPFVTVPVDTTSERGLMGIAFDSSFATDRYVYVY